MSERILWIDDYPENNEIERCHFERDGDITIKDAESTDEALGIIEKEAKFDLIISDVGRRDRGDSGSTSTRDSSTRDSESRAEEPGFEFLHVLREREGGEENWTPFIFYTSTYQVSRQGNRAQKYGAEMTATPTHLYKFVEEHIASFSVQERSGLESELDCLQRLTKSRDDNGRNKTKGKSAQQRGKQFEAFLKDLFTDEKLFPRGTFRPSGEEIDGSIVVGDRTFLVEAKWTNDKLPASTLYEFQGKVNGKLDGTIGIVISMSGYSENAYDALKAGKSLNLVLFDREDIEAAVATTGENASVTFEQILKAKLRHLAERGDVSGDVLDEVRKPTQGEESFGTPPQLFVVCELREDKYVLETFANKIFEEHNTNFDDEYSLHQVVRFTSAGGKMNIPAAASALSAQHPQHVIVLADTDGDEASTRDYIERTSTIKLDEIILVDSELESWLLPNPSSGSRARNPRIALKETYREEEGRIGVPTKTWLIDRVKKLDTLPSDAAFQKFRKQIEKAIEREERIQGKTHS